MCRYIPDAEKPDPAKQALPGSVDNSGCSFEFRYLESRHDVSVLNHTRVHLTFKDKVRRPPPRAVHDDVGAIFEFGPIANVRAKTPFFCFTLPARSQYQSSRRPTAAGAARCCRIRIGLALSATACLSFSVERG